MRHTLSISCVAAVAVLVGAFAPSAAAQNSLSDPTTYPPQFFPPDVLHNYRFLPRHSTLDVTGGIAGVQLTYNLFGKFGIATGYDQSPLAVYPPILVPHAEFVDVHAAALLDSHVADAAFVPLERFFDLESLYGTFELGAPWHLTFIGKDAQGARFELNAVQYGRLLHLRGGNAPGCCDFFQYEIDAFAHLAPYSDFNFDGRVDRKDLSALISNLGMAAGASLEDGDADGDGDVDGKDFFAWQRDAGTVIDMSVFADLDAVASPVPEPAAMLLSLLGFLPMVFWRSIRD